MLESSLASSLAGMNDRYAAAQASDGSGGLNNFPEPGEHEAFVIGCTFNTNRAFKYQGGPQEGIPGISIQLEYELIPDSTDPDFDPAKKAVTTPGAAVTILQNPDRFASLPENQQTRVRIEEERLKGWIQGIIGEENITGDFPTDLEAMYNKVQASESKPAITLVAKWDERNGNTYKKDYIKGSLSVD